MLGSRNDNAGNTATAFQGIHPDRMRNVTHAHNNAPARANDRRPAAKPSGSNSVPISQSNTSRHSRASRSNPSTTKKQNSDIKRRQKQQAKKKREAENAKKRKQKEMQDAAKNYREQPDVLTSSNSQFIAPLPFRNTLPDLPFEPKLVKYPFDVMELIKYQPTALERDYEHPLITEPDLGIPLLLIDPDSYNPPTTKLQPLAPQDRALLDVPLAAGAADGDVKAASGARRRPKKKLAWLRKTEYLDHAESLPTFKAGLAERPASQNTEPETRDAQVAAILKTFEDAQTIPTHPDPSKSWMKPVAIYEILPSETLWPNEYHEVRFETEPITVDSILREQTLENASGGNKDGGSQAQTDDNDDEDTPDKLASNTVSPADRDAAAAFVEYAQRHVLLRPDATQQREKFIDLYAPTRTAAADAARRQRVLAHLLEHGDAGDDAHESDDDLESVVRAPDETVRATSGDEVPPRELKRRRAYHYSVARDTKQRVIVTLSDDPQRVDHTAEYTQITSQINLRPVTQISYGLRDMQRPDFIDRQVRVLSNAETHERDRRLIKLGFEFEDDEEVPPPSDATPAQDEANNAMAEDDAQTNTSAGESATADADVNADDEGETNVDDVVDAMFGNDDDNDDAALQPATQIPEEGYESLMAED